MEETWDEKRDRIQWELQKRLRPLGYRANAVIFVVKWADVAAAIAKHLLESGYDANALTDKELKSLADGAAEACHNSECLDVEELLYYGMDAAWPERLESTPVSVGEVTTL